MATERIDRNKLAAELRRKIETKHLSARRAAQEIGCSAATVGRMLQGADAPNFPEGINLIRVASWLGRSVADFEIGASKNSSSIDEVEVHLRALPGIDADDAEGLVAMVRAVYSAKASKQSKPAKR